MLESQMVDGKMEDNNKKDNDNNSYSPEVEHRMIINWTPPDEKKFLLKRRFVSSWILSKSIPRRNNNLFRYRMNRSLNLDINSRKNRWLKSPNSSLDSSSDVDKSSPRDLSRSAKIMRALSLNSLVHHKNISIKKSLNFDSSPSPKKSSYFDRSPHDSKTINISPTFDKLLSYDTSFDSVTNSVLIVSSESIDENQNQTPQKTQKVAKILDDASDKKENLNISSDSSSSTSLLRSNLKEKILEIVQTPDLQSFKREKARIFGCVASTPRNLFQEFNQNEYDRPHTPENIMHLIPESMSAIKKSHKKEKLYHQEENICTQRVDVSTNEDFYIKKVESLEGDEIIAGGSCDTTFLKKSQKKKKKKNFKKTLVYDSDDELSDSKSISDHSAQWNEIPKINNSSENRSNEAKINKIQDINLNDEKCEENIQCNDNNKKEDHFAENDKEENLSIVQKESSFNVLGENVMSVNPSVSQNSSRAVTPENHINILQQVIAESIKKSHKKVKHGNKKIFKSLYQDKSISTELTRNNSIESNKSACLLNSQNSVRPNTPDNINSSRLLLTQFNSVKKSHRKDKQSKKIFGFAECNNQEYREKNDNSVRNNGNKQKDINDVSHKDSLESFELKNSREVLPIKKKKSMKVSVQNEACRYNHSLSFESSLGCKNIEHEFKIHTPIKKTSLKLFNIFNCTDKISEKDEAVQATPKEVDSSRCMTPIACYLKKSKQNENDISEEYTCADKSKINACILHNELADTANPEDKNGRSTPINMSTTELFYNINSIKKSHKKNKHSHSICKQREKELYKEKAKNVSFANSVITLEEQTASPLQFFDICSPSTEKGMCSNTCDVKEDKNYKEIINNNPQPSTSYTNDNIRNVTNINESNLLSATPPNDFNTANFITLFNTTSIKKFHKKERSYNAEAKYILMSSEHDLSDDGSIFDKDDKSIAESFDSC